MSESAAGETAAAGVGDATHELPIGVDGETLPAQEIVTGRGFITGKSGAGKSNTVTVVLEELFELGLPALVVDTDGEYWPLRERYDVLHVGGDADADTIVDESDADRLAELAIGDGVPIILDVSAFDADATAAIVEEAVGALFARAKRERRPYLLVVEEIHEYLPQRGSDDLSELLTAVAKRGRKYGLGLVGASQRPASVDKDFITQANWMVWHRLTYETDTGKAAQNLGKEYEEPVSSLADGEAFVQADWLEAVTTLQFRRKHVRDVGSTPDIKPFVESPTMHDTDTLIERFEGGESGGGESAEDAARDDPVCGGQCEAATYHRRAAEHLAADVVDLRSALELRRGDNVGEQCQDAELIAEIVGEEFGLPMGELYEEYEDRAADPKGKRMVREYLDDLRDAGRVVSLGQGRGRRHYPVPDGLRLPRHVSPADAVRAVRDADSVLDVQQGLRMERAEAKSLANSFETADLNPPNANEIHYDLHTDTEKITVRLPGPLVRGIEKGVEENRYDSRSDPVRRGVKKVVEPVEEGEQ